MFPGRSFNDLTQYPVVPWTLADYTSPKLDLSNPASFRDLSKPMGAQTAAQAERASNRFDAWMDEEGGVPAFHYGTHYSTGGYVLWYLLRIEPYTTLAVHLQDGHFDCPDRLFWSVGETWKNCTSGINDVKELVSYAQICR